MEKYGPLYPRLTKSSRHDEIDVKEVAFKAFKVAYDRESGCLGYKVSGEELNPKTEVRNPDARKKAEIRRPKQTCYLRRKRCAANGSPK